MTKKPDHPKNVKTKDELTFVTCPIHKLLYPKGESCPQCRIGKSQ
jgi:hypothetical protein